MTTPAADWKGIVFVCPRCRGALDARATTYSCARCATEYPIVSGIADFRTAPDPWISLEDDREKGLRLERETDGQSFETMVRAYWAMTPGTPAAFADRFTGHVRRAELRAGEWLARTAPSISGEDASGPWLDLGCGTADLAAAAGSGVRVVGIDVAYRWLVVARRRLLERGIAPLLVCCNAEALPFPDATFARALSLGMLEHCRSADLVMRDCRRVLVPGATLRLRTSNRFTLLAEPHVGVWGVGWMPRRWADRYVHWRNGERYLHHWPKGPGEIRRAMRRAGFRDVRVSAAPMLAADSDRLPGALRRVLPLYERVRALPGAGAVLGAVAPLLEVSGRAR